MTYKYQNKNIHTDEHTQIKLPAPQKGPNYYLSLDVTDKTREQDGERVLDTGSENQVTDLLGEAIVVTFHHVCHVGGAV